MYSDSDYTESSMTETGQFDSQHSLIKLKDRSGDKHTISLNMFIQMEHCEGDNLQKWLDQRRVITNDMDEAQAAIENRQKSHDIFAQMVEGVITMHA